MGFLSRLLTQGELNQGLHPEDAPLTRHQHLSDDPFRRPFAHRFGREHELAHGPIEGCLQNAGIIQSEG
jgi:hypothetical protein